MLRDYQTDICSRVREAFVRHRSVMVQMPTGTGKTVVLAELLFNEKLKMNNEELGCAKILVVAHRRELVEQIKGTIRRMKGLKGERFKVLKVERENGLNGEKEKGLNGGPGIVVESIQSISRRMEAIGFTPSLVVIDEAHHALAKTYRRMWEAWPAAKFLGLTATPCRLNGKGFTDLFEVLLCSLTVPEFIRRGVLAPFDYVAINEGSSRQLLVDSLQKRGTDGDYQVKEMNEVLNRRPSIKQLYDCYARFANGKKGIVYAVSIEHARSIAEYYESKGVKAVAISAKTPAKERVALLEQFRGYSSQGGTGGLQALVNVDIFSEGFDCPDVEFIQLARPTLSLAKYLQMVGRGLRPHKDKECCVILDNVGLVHVFGLPTRCWDWEGMFKGLKGEKVKGLKGEKVKGLKGEWLKGLMEEKFKGLKGEKVKGLKGERVEGLKGEGLNCLNSLPSSFVPDSSSLAPDSFLHTSDSLSFASDSLPTFSGPLSASPSSECSLIVAHEQLEQLIKDARLEEWNERQGIVEEEVEAFQDESSRLWGLRRGGKVRVPPTYLRVFNIREGFAAVRMQDTKLAVVDVSGRIVRNLGKGMAARLCSKDFVMVDRNKYQDYIDLLSGQIYYDLPKLVSKGDLQLVRTVSDGWMLRLKDPFVYGCLNYESYYSPIKEYGYFYMIYLSKSRGNVESYAVDTRTLIVLKGDNERAYWLYDVHEDGSIDVIDRHGNAYHVTPDGTKERLNRCVVLERSRSVLKEIATQYRVSGGIPEDNYEKMGFRNSVLHNRFADKLKAMRGKDGYCEG